MTWSKWNTVSQVGMHAGMMFFFVCLGIVVLRTLPVIHELNSTLTDTHRVVLVVGGTASQLQKASVAESTQLTAISTAANGDLTALHSVLLSLNQTVQSLSAAVGTANTAIAANSTTLQAQLNKIGPVLEQTKTTVAAVQPSLDNLNSAMKGVAAITNDQNIPKIMAHTEQTLANAESMTSDGAAVTKHYRDMILKPVSKVKAGLETGGRVLSWFIKLTIP